MLHHERFPQRRRQCRQRTVQITAQLRPVELLIRRRERQGLIILLVAQVRSPNVLQPILAAIGHDAEDPGIEATMHLSEVLIRFDKRRLEDILRYVRTPRHTERMPIEGIAVASDQEGECIPITRQHARNDFLVRLKLIDGRNWRRGCGLHVASVIPLLRPGKCFCFRSSECNGGCHALQTSGITWRNKTITNCVTGRKRAAPEAHRPDTFSHPDRCPPGTFGMSSGSRRPARRSTPPATSPSARSQEAAPRNCS